MERLLEDLRYFRQALETERDQFRRNILLRQIRDVQQEILNQLRAERAQLEGENKRLYNLMMTKKK